MITEHYKKTQGLQTRMKILRLLQRYPEGFNTGLLKTKIGVSMPVLSLHLKALEQKGQIENYRKPGEDRRFRWYRIKDKKLVDSEICRYEAIEFIDSISNPIYAFKNIGKGAVAAFVSSNVENLDESQQAVDAVVELIAPLTAPFVEEIGEKGKIAFVVMAGVKTEK